MTAEFCNILTDLTLEGSIFQRVGAPTAKELVPVLASQ